MHAAGPDSRTAMSRPIRLWILTNVPSPYQLEFFAAIHRSGAMSPDVRLMWKGRVTASCPPAHASQFNCRVMTGIGPRRLAGVLRIHPRAVWESLFSEYDFYILSGYYPSLTFLLCALLLWMRRRRWGLWMERPRPEDYSRSRCACIVRRVLFIPTLKRLVLSTLTKLPTRVLCIGSSAARAYRDLGASPDKLFILPYMCETEKFQTVAKERITAITERHQLDGKTVFLFSGQMIPRKGVEVVLAAFSRLAHEREDVALLLLGDGVLREQLMGSIDGAIRERVHFTGHVEQKDLPEYFRACSVFVFPSRYDGWAVVVNEACAAGLPIITTDCVGAAADLVVEGENGFIVPADDVESFQEKMRYFAEHPEQIQQFGERSRELVQRFSPDNGVRLLMNAICGRMS